jgi:hypothetical protein
VGYAPGDTRRLIDHLSEAAHGPDDLIAAGLATRSGRDRVHGLFHARIVFPITDLEGGVTGFAGLATHLGPSWPLWLTSPDRGPFSAGSAFFGLPQAREAISAERRALVLRDCVQVLALHQAGRRDVVAVIHSPITRAHIGQLASIIGTGANDLHFSRRDDRLGVLAAPAGTTADEAGFASRATPAGFTLIGSKSRQPGAQASFQGESELRGGRSTARPFVYAAGAIIGIGIPIGLLILAAPHNEAARGSTPTLNLVIGGVAATYLVLALAVARISAGVRQRSKARRMREPWARGSGEWQPAGWTYHRVEEILVGAALVSAVTCIVLLLTIGGFLG